MPAPAPVPAPDLTSHIVYGFEKIGMAMQLLLKRQAEEHGISPLQMRILLHIRGAAQPVTAASIAREFGLSRATVSVALKTILQKELVSGKADPADSRSMVIGLTDWGAQIAHVAGFYTEPLRKIVSLIATEEKELLLRNIEGIMGKLGTTVIDP